MSTILICDDNSGLANQYAYDLRRLAGHEVLVAASGAAALDVLTREAIDCLILDLELPGEDGFSVLAAIRDRGLDASVIVYTGTGNYDRCVHAMRLGAANFIDKEEPLERVVREIDLAIERRRLLSEVAVLRKYADAESALIGHSPAIGALKASISRLATIPSPVLIVGESGSGKEVVARDIHRLGAGPREPFIAVNSAALPEHLVESELFGHERGAFTGAVNTRRGAFESAGRGTLFLDEIGELPLAAQAKLLRVLEERAVVRVGSTRSIATPARVVAATNRVLEAEVVAGRFRRDLLFRLNAHVLRVPSLRERLSDVPELAVMLVAATCARYGMRCKRVEGHVLPLLMAYDWHQNNVRELRNVIERMIIAADGDTIEAAHVPLDIRQSAGAERAGERGDVAAPCTYLERRAEAERQIVVAALARQDGHVTRAAAELGLSDHASLLKIMRRLGVRDEVTR